MTDVQSSRLFIVIKQSFMSLYSLICKINYGCIFVNDMDGR